MARKPSPARGVTDTDNGDSGGDVETIDPAAITASASAGSTSDNTAAGTGTRAGKQKRKYTRRTGTKTQKSSRKASEVFLNAEHLTIMLKTVHDLVAFQTGAEMFRLTKAECEFIANPALAVMKYYGIDLPGVYGVWGNLLVALASVYAPRISAVLGITAPLEASKASGPVISDAVLMPTAGHDYMSDLAGAMAQ